MTEFAAQYFRNTNDKLWFSTKGEVVVLMLLLGQMSLVEAAAFAPVCPGMVSSPDKATSAGLRRFLESTKKNPGLSAAQLEIIDALKKIIPPVPDDW
jgi:hypothetical protein